MKIIKIELKEYRPTDIINLGWNYKYSVERDGNGLWFYMRCIQIRQIEWIERMLSANIK